MKQSPLQQLQMQLGMHLMFALMLAISAFALIASPAVAQGAASIVITNVHAESGLPLGFSRFMVTDSNGTVYGPLETSPGSGQVTFNVETVGDATTFDILEETPPPCGIVPDVETVGPIAAGEVLEVEIATSFSDCGQGAIAAYLYSCPDGVDRTVEDYSYFSQGCTSTLNGETFTFTTADGSQSWNPVTGAWGISGRAPIVGLSPGDYRLIDPYGADVVPVVYCLTYDSAIPSEAPNPSVIERKQYADNAINVSLGSNRIACDFFVVPGDQNQVEEENETEQEAEEEEESPIVEPAAENSILEIHKLTCEPGTDPQEVDLFDECHTMGTADIEFTIEGPNGFSDSGSTEVVEEDGAGILTFTDLQAGEYEVSEVTIPGDFVSVVIYCSISGEDTEVETLPTDTGGILLELPDGVRVVCDWYNIPDQQFEEGAVDVVKRTCPVGFAADASYNELVNSCSRTDDVTYILTRQGEEGVSGITGTDGSGQVIFTGLAPGDYNLYEDVPLHDVTVRAFCGLAANALQSMTVTDGSVELTIDGSGDTILCRFYNIPIDAQGGVASLSIEKYLCPVGTTSSYAAVCGKYPLAGTTFDLNGASDVSGVTGEDGSVFFGDLPTGGYTVTETPPAGVRVAVYVVGCQTESGESFPFTYNDSTGLRIEIELHDDENVLCGWYNVPPGQPKPQGPTGSITVHKLVCLGNDEINYNWDQDCETYSGGADFTLATVTGAPLASGTTNVNGILNFSGLATGTYALEETSAQWCHAESARVDARGNLQVTDKANTDVYIFNCSTTQVRAFPATGSGPDTGNAIALTSFLMAALCCISGVAVMAYQRVRMLNTIEHQAIRHGDKPRTRV